MIKWKPFHLVCYKDFDTTKYLGACYDIDAYLSLMIEGKL